MYVSDHRVKHTPFDFAVAINKLENYMTFWLTRMPFAKEEVFCLLWCQNIREPEEVTRL